jgi:hypothetical protein
MISNSRRCQQQLDKDEEAKILVASLVAQRIGVEAPLSMPLVFDTLRINSSWYPTPTKSPPLPRGDKEGVDSTKAIFCFTIKEKVVR